MLEVEQMLVRACVSVRSMCYLWGESVFRKCQVKVITEIRKNESGDRIKVERTVKVIHTPSLSLILQSY